MTDLIISADYILTMDAADSVIANGAIRVSGSRIADIGARADVLARAPGLPEKRLRNRLLMPGLVNAHAHSGFLRGTAESLPVWDWLTLHINPMHRVLQPADAEAASMLCYAEAVLSGTTTIVDMWRFMDGSARAATAIGNRVVMVPYVGAHPDYDYFDTLDDNERVLETWHRRADGRINVWAGLEHLFYADDAGQRRAIELAKKFDTGFHTHSSEADIEVSEMQKRYGLRPMAAFKKLGLFEARKTLIAHAVWLDDAEIETLARHDVGVAHNPVSNMKLASGIARVEDMLTAGLAVGIGTDGEKENNNLDMFEEMKVASLLAKLGGRNAAALDSWKVLRMATAGGARALGLDDEIGTLETGKKADMIAVRTDTPRMTPLFGDAYFNLHHNLVHAVRGGDVDMTMVDGRIIVGDGALKSAEMHALIEAVHRLAPDLFARRAAYLRAHAEGTKQWTQG